MTAPLAQGGSSGASSPSSTCIMCSTKNTVYLENISKIRVLFGNALLNVKLLHYLHLAWRVRFALPFPADEVSFHHLTPLT